MSHDELITTKAAAELLGVHRSVVNYLIERGDLTAARMPPQPRAPKGRRLLLQKSQVEALGDNWRRRRKRGAGGTGSDDRPPV
jgi:excisionase family DNA binding protein